MRSKEPDAPARDGSGPSGSAAGSVGQPAEFARATDPAIPHVLTLVQAVFVYEAARLAALASAAPVIPKPWDERELAFKKQFVAVIERQMGSQRSNSPAELHGSWMQAYFAMGWKYGEKYDQKAKTHPDLVPYDKLGQLERNKDAVFIALCEIARQWIYEVTEG